MIKKIIEPLESVAESLKREKRPIFLYGMGNGAEKIFVYLSENEIKISGVVASEGFVRGQSFLGFKVISVSEAEKSFGSLCLVICFGLEGKLSRFLKDLAAKHRIISPNLPVFGNGVCDKKFILTNYEKFNKVYEILADDISKEIYLNLIKYNVTGDISYLDFFNNAEPPIEFFKHNLRHIDVGAYDGDTVTEFVNKNGDYNDIVAFEPDSSTFKKLVNNTKGFRSVITENAAVGQKSGKIRFASGGGRASHCSDEGIEINCFSIDDYCGFKHISAKGTVVGSIKIDAEGMDEEVICGSVNTLYCCNCSVCVALYHRAEDIIELPLLLRKHNSKFKFYIRKKEYIPAWDTFLYAIAER